MRLRRSFSPGRRSGAFRQMAPFVPALRPLRRAGQLLLYAGGVLRASGRRRLSGLLGRSTLQWNISQGRRPLVVRTIYGPRRQGWASCSAKLIRARWTLFRSPRRLRRSSHFYCWQVTDFRYVRCFAERPSNHRDLWSLVRFRPLRWRHARLVRRRQAGVITIYRPKVTSVIT